MPPANNLFFLVLAGWAASSNLLFGGYSPGLFVFNEGPKSHCPIVYSTLAVRNALSCMVVLKSCASPCHLCQEPFPGRSPNFDGLPWLPWLQERADTAAASVISSPCGHVRSRSQMAQMAQSRSDLCAKPRCLGPLSSVSGHDAHCNY